MRKTKSVQPKATHRKMQLMIAATQYSLLHTSTYA